MNVFFSYIYLDKQKRKPLINLLFRICLGKLEIEVTLNSFFISALFCFYQPNRALRAWGNTESTKIENWRGMEWKWKWKEKRRGEGQGRDLAYGFGGGDGIRRWQVYDSQFQCLRHFSLCNSSSKLFLCRVVQPPILKNLTLHFFLT